MLVEAVVRWSAVLLSYDEEPVRDSHELEFGVADVADLVVAVMST